MKQIKFFAMALAAMSMFSCSTEEAADATIPDGGDGSAAYAQFTLKMPDATRAAITTDGNADARERAIKDATVYLMSKGVVEKKIVLKKVETGAGATATTEWKSDPMKLAAGTRQVVAIVNQGKFTFAEGTAFNLLVGTKTGVKDQVIGYSETVDIDNNLVSSSKVISANIVGPTSIAPTVVDVPVSRTVAKVIVKDGIAVNSNFSIVTYKKSGATANQGLTNRAAFCVMADAQTSYLLQTLGNAGLPVNPTDITWTALPTDVKNATYRPLAKDGALTNTISGLPTANGDNRGGQYVLENIAGKLTTNKEVTQLFVRVALRPTKYTNADGSETTLPADGTGANPGDVANYYLLKHLTDINQSKIFESQANFDTWYAAQTTATKDLYATAAVLYTKGYNYYQVAIKHDATNEATMYSMMRNTLYNVTLGKVMGFGGNGDGKLVDPDQPVEPEAWLQATVTIMPWTVKDINAPLE